MTGPKLNEGALLRRRRAPTHQGHCQVPPRLGLQGPRGARPHPRPRRAPRRRDPAVHRPRRRQDIRKVLASAVANAVHNDEQDADELFVKACFADEGPTLKRFRPRARGRATRIRKRTCHITVVVARLERRPPRGRPGPPGRRIRRRPSPRRHRRRSPAATASSAAAPGPRACGRRADDRGARSTCRGDAGSRRRRRRRDRGHRRRRQRGARGRGRRAGCGRHRRERAVADDRRRPSVEAPPICPTAPWPRPTTGRSRTATRSRATPTR